MGYFWKGRGGGGGCDDTFDLLFPTSKGNIQLTSSKGGVAIKWNGRVGGG